MDGWMVDRLVGWLVGWSVNRPFSPSACLSDFLSICLPVCCLFTCLSVCCHLSLCTSIRPSIRLSVSFYPSLCLSLSVCLSWLFVRIVHSHFVFTIPYSHAKEHSFNGSTIIAARHPCEIAVPLGRSLRAIGRHPGLNKLPLARKRIPILWVSAPPRILLICYT